MQEKYYSPIKVFFVGLFALIAFVIIELVTEGMFMVLCGISALIGFVITELVPEGIFGVLSLVLADVLEFLAGLIYYIFIYFHFSLFITTMIAAKACHSIITDLLSESYTQKSHCGNVVGAIILVIGIIFLLFYFLAFFRIFGPANAFFDIYGDSNYHTGIRGLSLVVAAIYIIKKCNA